MEQETDEIFSEMHQQRDREENFRELNGVCARVSLRGQACAVLCVAARMRMRICGYACKRM